MQALAVNARFINAKVQAEVAVTGIHKPKENQRAQITGVP
jgi:hypothetical protein